MDWRIRLLYWVISVAGRDFHEKISVPKLRAGFAEMNRRFGMPKDPHIEITDRMIEAPDGASLLARIYRPPGTRDEALPAIVYFHGGGWVIGDVDSYDHLTRFFSSEGLVVVIAVEYRLGPEHRFPTAFEDGFTALAWAQRCAHELGIDATRIAVGGDSAGAGIAASLAAYATQRGLERPAFSLLIYPPVDGSARFPSRRAFLRGVPLTTPMIGWYSERFFRNAGDSTSPLMMQLDAPAPQSHPPTYILAAGYDPLVDEGRAYAQRLREAGVTVTYDFYPSLAHGLVNFPRVVPQARRALRRAIRVTAEGLSARGAGL